MIDNVSDLLSLCSACTIATSCTLYLFQIRKGVSTPILISWIVWVSIAIVNGFNYYHVVGHNFCKTVMVTVHAVFMLLIFTYTYKTGKFRKVVRYDTIFCLVLVGIVTVFWLVYKEHNKTSIALQAINTLSFLPTINGIRKEGAREKTFSWYFSIVAYIFLTLSVVLSPNGSDWVDYVFPVSRGVLCAVVIYFATRKNRFANQSLNAS